MTNPALQVLLHSAPFLLGMLEQDPKQLPPLTDLNKLKAREATNVLCNLLAQMVGVSSAPQVRRSISTLSCQGALDARFNGGKSHEDAEEFLSFLLNTLLESATPGQSPAESMRGSSDQTLECPHCTQVSTIRSTPFFTWQIPLPSQEADSHSHKLSDLFLDSCTLPETLDEDNMCFCSTCNEQRAYCKSDTISSLPDILCVHLKRFTLNTGTGQTAKLMTLVDIEDTLQYFGSAEQGSAVNLNLFSIVMHDGSRHRGHYLTICRCSGCAALQDISACPSQVDDRAEWCIFDDAYVSGQKTRSACMAEILQSRPNATSYLAFFVRVGSAHEASTHCPVCWKNGNRVKEMARAMISPSPADQSQSSGKEDSSENSDDNSSDQSSLQDMITSFLQGRKYVRANQVQDN